MSGFDDLLYNDPAGNKEEYATRKKAEREAVFELSDSTALEIGGDGGRFQQYLDTQARFSRHSTVNTMLNMAQKPEATRIGSFDYWKGRGGSVKANETGISILEPHKYMKDDHTPGVGYDIKKVFDISQVDTQRMKPDKPAPPAPDNRQLLQALIHKAPVKITGVDTLPGGLGAQTDPQTGEIQVRKGMEFADTFRSVAQELAYADLTTGPDTQADPHFSAYCASYLLCQKHGVDTKDFNFENAPAVLEGMDTQEIKGELSEIRDVAANIAGRMARQLEVANRPPRSGDGAR